MENFDVFKLDGRSLKVFLSVCDTGSVSQTAANFDLNQSTISHTLDKLRTAIGDHLFVKSGRGITPTEKALALRPKVQKLLAELEGLVETDIYDASKDVRPLSVAIPSPSLVGEMRRLFEAAAVQAPDIRLHLKRLAPRSRLFDMLTSGEADVAIALAESGYSALLNHCPYFEDEFAVFYDPDVRGPVRDLEDYVTSRHGAAGFGGNVKSVVEIALGQAGVRREIVLVSPTVSMLGPLIKGTSIITTMPRKLGDTAFKELAYCAPPIDLPSVNYDLVWHRRYDHSGRNIWLRELLMDAAPEASNRR